MDNERLDRIKKYYPVIYICGRLYLVRCYTRKAKGFSFWKFKIY